jgi:hypothetical protein
MRGSHTLTGVKREMNINDKKKAFNQSLLKNGKLSCEMGFFRGALFKTVVVCAFLLFNLSSDIYGSRQFISLCDFFPHFALVKIFSVLYLMEFLFFRQFALNPKEKYLKI